MTTLLALLLVACNTATTELKQLASGNSIASRAPFSSHKAASTGGSSRKSAALSPGKRDSSDPTILPLLGVISGPTPVGGPSAPDITRPLQDIGVRSIRNNDYYDDSLDIEGIWRCPGESRYPAWSTCSPKSKGAMHWDKSDRLFDAIADGGFEMMLRLGGEWQNHDVKHQFKGPRDRTQEDRWIQAAELVADRYMKRQGKRHVIKQLNIWTEYPGKHFWDRPNRDFAPFYARAFKTLKKRFPQVPLGGPGFDTLTTTMVTDGNGQVAIRLLTALYRERVRPDWVGWHLFTVDPDRFGEAAVAWRHLLDGTGSYASVPWAGSGFFKDTDMMVDAWGTAKVRENTRGQKPSPLSRAELTKVRSGSLGAAIITASWIEMQHADVAGAWYYRASDPAGGGARGDGALGPGLLTGDAKATPKPAAHAFRLFSRMASEFSTKLTVGPKHGDLYVLAGQSKGGDTAWLVANPGSSALTWRPEGSSGQVYTVDNSQDGRSATRWSGDALTLPAATVQLVVVSK